jgi:hypothetical protein
MSQPQVPQPQMRQKQVPQVKQPEEVRPFDLITDDSIQQICQEMYAGRDYISLSNFIKSDTRARRLCAPLLAKAKETARIFKPTEVKPRIHTVYDRLSINTVKDLQEFLDTHPSYKMTEHLDDLNSLPSPLIVRLLKTGNRELIAYLINHNPMGKTILEFTYPGQSTLLVDCIRRGDIKGAMMLIDLGAPVNELSPILIGAYDDDLYQNTRAVFIWATPLYFAETGARVGSRFHFAGPDRIYDPLVTKLKSLGGVSKKMKQ